jgi:hypothetical protein
MTLNNKVQVDMPEKGISVHHLGNYNYVYKTIKSYRNSHGTPTKERVCIRKWDPKTEKLVPNTNYYKYYGQKENNSFKPNFKSIRQIA